MGDNRTDLPEGTDAIITGASNIDDAAGASSGASFAALCTAM